MVSILIKDLFVGDPQLMLNPLQVKIILIIKKGLARLSFT